MKHLKGEIVDLLIKEIKECAERNNITDAGCTFREAIDFAGEASRICDNLKFGFEYTEDLFKMRGII